MSLQAMNLQWEHLNIANYFIYVHHFSSGTYTSLPSTLPRFIDYCERNCIGGENVQTIKRARQVASYVDYGVKPDLAIIAAWENYPLINK